jgi:hypothetical protein
LHDIYEEKILFNQWMGLKVESIKATGILASLAMKPELVGHFAYHRIHGGVISAVLDAMGRFGLMAAMGAKHMDDPLPNDWNVLRDTAPLICALIFCALASAKNSSFIAEAMRVGARVGNARMEFAVPMANCCQRARLLISLLEHRV